MSERVAVLARRDHPKGWGFPVAKTRCPACGHVEDWESGTAHGWSVLLVACENDEETGRLAKHVRDSLPIRGVFGSEWWDTWYGGVFDLVAWLSPGVTFNMIGGPSGSNTSQSVGDNRYVGILKASDLFAALDGDSAP